MQSVFKIYYKQHGSKDGNVINYQVEYMKQITNILFLTILCVLFASCGEKNIDMNKIQVSISNNQYKICEDINQNKGKLVR